MLGEQLGSQYIADRSVDNRALERERKLTAARKIDEQNAYRQYMEKMEEDQVLPTEQVEETGETVEVEAQPSKDKAYGKAVAKWGLNLPRNITAGVIDGATSTMDMILGDAKEGADQWIAESFPEYADGVRKFRGWMNPQNAGDEVTQELARFAVPFTGYLKAFGAASHTATKAKKFADVVGADIVANIANMDPHMERFSGLLKQLGLENDFISYIADTENETEAEGRLKNAIDSVGIAAPIVGTVFGSAKALKGLWHNLPEMAERVKNFEPMKPGSLESQKGMFAYHGTPHKFDEFDMSKIGTGEGAQAYGYGLYFAESPGVAKSYKSKLSSLDHIVLDPAKIVDEVSDLGFSPESLELARTTLEKLSNNVGQALSGLDGAASQRGSTIHKEAADVIRSFKPSYENVDTGSLYEVDIPDSAVDKMLDWDAPLSEQAESVKKALKEAFPNGWTGNKNPSGADIYKDLFGGQAQASNRLNSLGIPGIKYFDQGSRVKGEGTRNLVVFDDKLPKIKSANGKPKPDVTKRGAIGIQQANELTEDEFIKLHKTGDISFDAYTRTTSKQGFYESIATPDKVKPLTELPKGYAITRDRNKYYAYDTETNVPLDFNRNFDSVDAAKKHALEIFNQRRLVGRTKFDLYPEIHGNLKDASGKEFEIRKSGEKNKYVAKDETGEIIRDDAGLATYMTEDQVKKAGLATHDQNLYVFDGNEPVAYASNEFGAIGVMVRDDYQKRGIGSKLLAQFMKENPSMKIGQMTPDGEKMSRSAYKILAKDKK